MPSPKNLYLIGYNTACCLGWAFVLFLALSNICPVHVLDTLSNIYAVPRLAETLAIVQTAALLEIVHAAVGIVRSPVFVTTLQVGSRIAALFCIMQSPHAQTQSGAGIMILSWSLVEVPRYAFYVAALITGDATKKTPYPLFWLRYSLFYILYPTGITGELSVFLEAKDDPVFLNFLGHGYHNFMWYFVMSFPVIYAPGALPMIFNMVHNRKNAFRKRFAKAPPPPRGLVFPKSYNKRTGKEDRASTPAAKAVLGAALEAVNPEKARSLEALRNWRFGYVKYFMGLVEEQCSSPKAALAAATAGLDKLYNTFEFIYADGTTCTLAEAMKKNSADKFFTGVVKGEGTKKDNVLEVPYKGKTLSGEALRKQVQKWVEYGTIEPSAGESICACIDKPGYLDLSDKYFVLLGAGSAMGPFLVLMALGANVIAIDLDREHIWKRLIKIAKESSGTLTFPLRRDQSELKHEEQLFRNAGSNLFTQTPMIKDWLLDLYPGKAFTVGSYAYLDGALHVQVSLAMDFITKALTEKRPKTSLAYLCTPTDIHLIPKEAYDASIENQKSYDKRIFCKIMKLLGRGKFLRKNVRGPIKGEDGSEYYVVNGMSVAQGPNYALAKRMQHWRAISARHIGCTVSSNIAPSTSTVSVVHNRTFAWAYEGMPYFKPYEIFAPETSNSVMSAILFSDLNDDSSASNPKAKIRNPNELFSFNSFHGGMWRAAYAADSIGETSVLIYFSRVAKPYLIIGGGVTVAVVAKFILG